jgi:uncharacterized protein (TIRG00374 family)
VWIAAGSLLLGSGFAWLLGTGALPLVPPRNAWANTQHWALSVYVLAFGLIHVIRCCRWATLLPPAQRPRLGTRLSIGLLGYGAIVVLPFRLGEAVRPALLHREIKLPIGTSAGVVAAERVFDGLVLSLILLVALLGSDRLSPLPDHIGMLPVPAVIIPRVAIVAVLGFAALCACMVAFCLSKQLVQRWIEAVIGRLSRLLAERVVRAVESFATGLRLFHDPNTLLPFALYTALYWALNVGGIWFLLWGCGLPSPSLAHASVVLGVLGLGVLVPNAPGFFGSFQISVYAGLVLFDRLEVVTAAGATFAFFLYVAQMGVMLGGAGATLVARIIGSRATSLPDSDVPRGAEAHQVDLSFR